MKATRRRVATLAAAVAALTFTLVIALMGNAWASNYLYNGSTGTLGMWVEVQEIDGSQFQVHPGEFSPSSPGIRAFRAPEGFSVYFKYVNGDGVLRRCANNQYTSGWCLTNGRSINVRSVKPG